MPQSTPQRTREWIERTRGRIALALQCSELNGFELDWLIRFDNKLEKLGLKSRISDLEEQQLVKHLSKAGVWSIFTSASSRR
jgi:hypothetical protein